MYPKIVEQKKGATQAPLTPSKKTESQKPRLTAVNSEETTVYDHSDASQTPLKQLINTHLNTLEADALALEGAQALAQYCDFGTDCPITSLVQKVARTNDKFSVRLLNDKSKPLLIESGLLIKVNGNKHQWLTEPKPEKPAPIETKEEPPKPKKTSTKKITAHLQKALDTAILWKAKRDPYAEIMPDGSVKKIRKPFSGELTTAEKKAKREAAEKAAFQKIMGQGIALSDEAIELAKQKQIEMIERKAAQQAAMDTLWMWAKVLGFIALVVFAISSTGTGTPVDTYLPQGIHQ